MAAADELAPRFSSPFLTEDSPEPDVPTFSFRRISNAISTISRKRRLSSFEASKSLKWRRRGTIAKGKQPVWTDPEAAEKLWREGYCRETEAGEDAGNGDEVDETGVEPLRTRIFRRWRLNIWRTKRDECAVEADEGREEEEAVKDGDADDEVLAPSVLLP